MAPPSAIYSSTVGSVEISYYVAQHTHTKLRYAQRNHTLPYTHTYPTLEIQGPHGKDQHAPGIAGAVT